jgi:hypothetical protein
LCDAWGNNIATCRELPETSGRADTQSVKLADARRRAEAEVTLQVYKGSGHGGRALTSPRGAGG